jgi:hypothetical protein
MWSLIKLFFYSRTDYNKHPVVWYVHYQASAWATRVVFNLPMLKGAHKLYIEFKN